MSLHKAGQGLQAENPSVCIGVCVCVVGVRNTFKILKLNSDDALMIQKLRSDQV